MVEHNAGVLQASTGIAAIEKIAILDGASADGSACTFCLGYEDHTLGNALRWIIMKDPDVEFCGYSAPHPSEPKIHIRVQMYDSKSAVDCFFKALGNLRDLLTTVRESYDKAMLSADNVREDDINVKEQVARIVSNAKGGDMEE